MICHICPWWIGYLLASPIRRWLQDPDAILSPHVKPGMTVLEVGPGMGFFTVPLARLVGTGGKVVPVDVQEVMLKSLQKRVRKAGLADRVDARLCPPESLGVDDLAGAVDFVLAFAVVHEIPDQAGLFAQVTAALKPGGEILVSEPKGHVSDKALAETIAIAEAAGLVLVEHVEVPRGRSCRLKKPDA